jgi:predicted nucleotidyltransferase
MYDTLLQEIVDEVSPQEEILGILLTGSVARGDGLPGCDLDLRFLLTAGNHRKTGPELRKGVLIERGYTDLALAQSKLEINPMVVYAYLDGRIPFDPEGILRHLREQAKERFETYRTSEHERDKIAYWLKSAHLKMTVVSRASDLLKATFVASTTSWEILVGLWAINDKPMPQMAPYGYISRICSRDLLMSKRC